MQQCATIVTAYATCDTHSCGNFGPFTSVSCIHKVHGVTGDKCDR